MKNTVSKLSVTRMLSKSAIMVVVYRDDPQRGDRAKTDMENTEHNGAHTSLFAV